MTKRTRVQEVEDHRLGCSQGAGERAAEITPLEVTQAS